MLAFVSSCGLTGIDGFKVSVEINMAHGMPQFEIVGLPDASVKESRERVRAALKNSGYQFPAERMTVNLAPADMKKEGPAFDLPIALGMLACMGLIDQAALNGLCVFGELSLNGAVRPVRGALPMVISELERGMKRFLLPAGNAGEVSCIEGAEIIPVDTLAAAVRHLTGELPIQPQAPVAYRQLISRRQFSEDFCHVKGQAKAKRALEIAAAGSHNVLLIGPPGSGKTLMARCMPTILPDMTFEEALETTRIHSAAGIVPPTGLLTERPFRSPHHTASHASLVGGGPNALPGEISKAHNGVLFLDELPEYRRDVLEALRQPMEDGFVTITRVNAQSTYPSREPLPLREPGQPHPTVPVYAQRDTALPEPHFRPPAGPDRHAHRSGVHPGGEAKRDRPVRVQRQHPCAGGGRPERAAGALQGHRHPLQRRAQRPHPGRGLPDDPRRQGAAAGLHRAAEAVQPGLYPHPQGRPHHRRPGWL